MTRLQRILWNGMAHQDLPTASLTIREGGIKAQPWHTDNFTKLKVYHGFAKLPTSLPGRDQPE